MARVRLWVSRFVGTVQCGLGIMASLFALLIYAIPSIRDMIAIASEQEVYVYMFLLMVFGAFSTMSGLLLVREKV